MEQVQINIDRIEGSIAIVVYGEGDTVDIDAGWLPEDAEDGSVLQLTIAPMGDPPLDTMTDVEVAEIGDENYMAIDQNEEAWPLPIEWLPSDCSTGDRLSLLFEVDEAASAELGDRVAGVMDLLDDDEDELDSGELDL